MMRSQFVNGILIAALLAATPFCWAQQSVDLAKSQITFVSKQMNVPIEGKFDKFTAQVRFDPKQPETGKAEIEIDVGSIDAGSSEANAEVKRPAWFDAAKFPKATFSSTALKVIGGGRYEAVGKLTIKSITRDVVAPFSYSAPAGSAGLVEGRFIINRAQFKIGDGIWDDPETVAREVEVRFKLMLRAAAAPPPPAQKK
jgi:polyisoprenoid-binding protein YceI